MSKYIDAEKLIAEIMALKEKYGSCVAKSEVTRCYKGGRLIGYEDVLNKIKKLQQEQPEAQNGKFVFPKYLYARTKDNKTIDMSYAPQDMTAVEYVRNDFVQQEQPEVDLFECPKTSIKDAVEVASRMKYIDEELRPIAEFIMRFASWNLHKSEWNQPTIEVPLFRVLDALAQRGKPYCEG